MNYQVWDRNELQTGSGGFSNESVSLSAQRALWPNVSILILRRYEDNLLGLHVRICYQAVVIRCHSWTRYLQAAKPGPTVSPGATGAH